MSSMRYIWLMLAVLLVAFQQPGFQKIVEVPCEAYYLTTDNLGNAYVMTTGHDLNKYKPDGSYSTTQNFKANGSITSVDVSNTMQINVFYKPLNKVIILDNVLAFRGELLLRNLGITQATACARSFDNGLWVFDASDLLLKKIDKDLKQVTEQSPNVRLFVEKGKTLAPDFIFDDASRVYVNNPETGILVFDIFAQYIKTIPVKGLHHFQVIGNELIYFRNNHLQRYNLRSSIQTVLQLPDTTDLLDARLEKERLYLLKKNGLTLYAY
ncbi:MAG: hypothetical protein WC150_10525 [Bacteroidia bacterium]